MGLLLRRVGFLCSPLRVHLLVLNVAIERDVPGVTHLGFVPAVRHGFFRLSFPYECLEAASSHLQILATRLHTPMPLNLLEDRSSSES